LVRRLVVTEAAGLARIGRGNRVGQGAVSYRADDVGRFFAQNCST